MLVCHVCKIEKDESCFSKQTKKKRGYSYRCKECHNEYVREKWYPDNKEKQIKSSYEWKKNNKIKFSINKYKLSDKAEDIENHLLKLNGKCEICDEESNLCLDHCHRSLKFRGFLCSKCNSAIGFLKEDVSILKRAINYLENKNEHDT